MTSIGDTGATGTVGRYPVGANAVGAAATGAGPPKFGIGNGRTELRLAGRFPKPGRPVAEACCCGIALGEGGTLKVAVASGA